MGQFWLARQQGHMKPSGFGSYVSGWRIHVSPRWESVPPAEIRQSDVQSWIAELSAKRWPVVVETCARCCGGSWMTRWRTSPAASGLYVAVAVGPLGWHGGIGNSPYLQASTRCSGLIASMEARLSSRSCREREGT